MQSTSGTKARIPFKLVCDEISEKYRVPTPENDIKFLADPKNGMDFFTQDLYEHIYDSKTGRSYRDVYGSRAAEQFCSDIENNIDIQADEEFEYSMVGTVSKSGLRTRENALNTTDTYFDRYMRCCQNVLNRAKEAEAVVARENANNNNFGDISQNAEKQKQEEKAATENSQKDRETNIRIQQEIEQQRQIYEQQRLSQLAADELKHSDEILAEQTRYEEIKKAEQTFFEQSQKEIEEKYEAEIKESFSKYEESKKEFEQLQEQYQQAISNSEISTSEIKKTEESYKKQEEIYKKAEENYLQVEQQASKYKTESIEKLTTEHESTVHILDLDHATEIAKIEAQHNSETERIYQEYKEKEQKAYDDTSKSIQKTELASQSEPKIEEQRKSIIEQIVEQQSETSYSQDVIKTATGYNVSESTNGFFGQERRDILGFDYAMEKASRSSQGNSLSFAFEQKSESSNSEQSALERGRMLSDEKRDEHANGTPNKDDITYAEQESARSRAESMEAINKLHNENASRGNQDVHEKSNQTSQKFEEKASSTEPVSYLSKLNNYLKETHPEIYAEQEAKYAQMEYDSKYGAENKSQPMSYDRMLSRIIVEAAEKTGFGEFAEAASYAALIASTASQIHKIYAEQSSDYETAGKDTLMKGIDEFNSATQTAYTSAKTNSKEYTTERYSQIAMEKTIASYKENNPFSATIMEAYNKDEVNKRIESTMRIAEGYEDFVKQSLEGVGQAKTSTTADVNNSNKLNSTVSQTNAHTMQTFANTEALAKTMSSFTSESLKKMMHSARVNQLEGMESTSYMNMFVTPAAIGTVFLIRNAALYKHTVNTLNQIDFTALKNLLDANNAKEGLNVLNGIELKTFGKETILDFGRGSKISTEFMEKLQSQMYVKYAKNGGTIYSQKVIKGKDIRRRLKELEKSLKTATGQHAKELKEETMFLKQILKPAKGVQEYHLGIKNLKDLKQYRLPITMGARMILSNMTDDTGRSMANAGLNVVTYSKHIKKAYNKYGKKAYNAIKNSKLMNKAIHTKGYGTYLKTLDKNVKAGKNLLDAGINAGKGAGKTVLKAGAKTAKNTKKIVKSTRTINKAQRMIKSTKMGTKIFTKAGSWLKTSGSLLKSSGTMAKGLLGTTKLGAQLAHIGANVSAWAASLSGTAASGVGAGATAAVTVGTGGIALIVILIVAIILCICCCVCSMGAQYDTYSSVDAFYIAKDGTSQEAAKSLSTYTMAFMSTHFEENYETFIYNGVESYIESFLEGVKTSGGQYIVPDYSSQTEHEKGRLTYIHDTSNPPLTYGHYVFYKGASAIYYNDIDHFLNYDIASYNIQIDESDPTQYILTHTDLGAESDGKEPKSRIYNEKEIIAMSCVLLQNDFSMDANKNNNNSTRTFEAYSFSMWLSSHYCVTEEDSSKKSIFSRAKDWIGNLFDDIKTKLFGDNDAEQVEKYYLKYVEGEYDVNSEYIKLVSIRFEWDSFDDVNDCPNWIVALNENEYAPESQHYIGTPLVFDVPSEFITIDNNIFTTEERKNYNKLVADWQKSEFTYAESIQVDTTTDSISKEGAESTIDNSIFMTQEWTTTYQYQQYEVDTSKVNSIVHDWIEAKVDEADNECDCNDADDPDTIEVEPSCGCDDCSCKEDADDAIREYYKADDRWHEALTSYNSETALVNAGIIKLKEYNDGKAYLFDSSTSSLEAAKTEAKALVNELYDKLDENFGDIEADDKGMLLLDALEAYETMTTEEVTIGTESKQVTISNVDETLLPNLLKTGTKNGEEYYNTSCLHIKVPYGDGYDAGITSTKQGFTIREEALKMIDDAYNDSSITNILTYRPELPVQYNGSYGYYNFNVKTAKKETYIMLFAPKQYFKLTSNLTSGIQIKYENLYKQYFICGGHTKLAIEPVVLTYSGSETLFDVDTVKATPATSGYADNEINKNFLNLKFIDPATSAVISNLWVLDDAIGRENILNAINMVDCNWEQKYNFDYDAVSFADTSGNPIKISDGEKFIDNVTYSLYQTETERTAVTSSNLNTIAAGSKNTKDKIAMSQSIESMTAMITADLLRRDSSLDQNGDELINKEDYDAVKDSNQTLAKNITSAINRIDRCVLALNLVGKVGYSQTCHDYVVSGPLKQYWSHNNSTLTSNELADLLSAGDEYDCGLVYKTDCSGFVSYILGIDNNICTSAIFNSSSITVNLPDISETAENFKDWDSADALLKAIYDNGNNSSITFAHTSVGWGSTPSIKPGDAVAKNGHVMLYVGTDESGNHWFVECTGLSKLGPGGVVLSTHDAGYLAEYNGGIIVDFDLRVVNFEINRTYSPVVGAGLSPTIIVSGGGAVGGAGGGSGGSGGTGGSITIEMPSYSTDETSRKNAIKSALGKVNIDGVTLTSNQIKGILANLYVESHFNPSAKNGLGYYGIMQWGGGRKQNLMKYSNYASLEVQVAYMVAEWTQGGYESSQFKKFLNYTATHTSAEDAAEAFAVYCERCPGKTGHDDGISSINNKWYQDLELRKAYASSM